MIQIGSEPFPTLSPKTHVAILSNVFFFLFADVIEQPQLWQQTQ